MISVMSRILPLMRCPGWHLLHQRCIPPSPYFHRAGGRRAAGFTLLELTISITMIGIIVLIIAAATRLGFRSVDAGEKKIELLDRIRTSLAIIDSQVQSEIPLTVTEEGVTKYYFTGSRKSMFFPTNTSLWSGQAAYVFATYTVAADNRGKEALVISEQLVGTEQKREATLLTSFDEIYFEYFYTDPTEEQGKWVEQWPEPAALPAKIRLHLIEGKRDMTMVIPLRARGTLSQTTPGGLLKTRETPL